MNRVEAQKLGLTLIEVMMAIVLIGTGFVAILTMSAKSLKIVQVAEEYETARQLLERLRLEEPLQIDDVDGDDRETGRFDDDEFRRYRWERTITQVGEESDDLYQVTTAIIWERVDEPKREELSTLLHLPTARNNGWIDENAE